LFSAQNNEVQESNGRIRSQTNKWITSKIMDKTGRDASPMICLSFYIYSYQVYEFCNTVFLELKQESEIYL